jgi:ketosteroid isomerase-like protein
MSKAEVDRWLEEYVAAWASNDRARIGALFADDVEYRYHPYDEPIRGRQAVVEAWLGEGEHPTASTPDEPGTFDATYEAVAVDGAVAVATGETVYRSAPGGPVDKIYDNCFVIEFDGDGRCRRLTEWFMLRPQPS